jgi:hypothetical protein
MLALPICLVNHVARGVCSGGVARERIDLSLFRVITVSV